MFAIDVTIFRSAAAYMPTSRELRVASVLLPAHDVMDDDFVDDTEPLIGLDDQRLLHDSHLLVDRQHLKLLDVVGQGQSIRAHR